jgi:hypothetical protein
LNGSNLGEISAMGVFFSISAASVIGCRSPLNVTWSGYSANQIDRRLLQRVQYSILSEYKGWGHNHTAGRHYYAE